MDDYAMKNLVMKYKAIAPWKRKMIKLIFGIVIGAGIGFAYYKFVGCSTGTCPLTSNPFISTLYGAVMGVLISGMNG
jgi:hypothetical protein